MPRRDPEQKTKVEIVKTAAQLFSERGWNGVTIEDVVQELGVTSGAFYYYFKSREELVYAVITQSLTDDNPFALASKQTELNAIEKLRFALKRSLKSQLEVLNPSPTLANAMLKTMYDPIVFKSNALFSVNVFALHIEKLLIEGNADGSLSAQYPKHAAQAAAMLFNEWLNPSIFQMTSAEFADRLSFLEQFGVCMGIPVLDEQLKEMLLQLYESCKQS